MEYSQYLIEVANGSYNPSQRAFYGCDWDTCVQQASAVNSVIITISIEVMSDWKNHFCDFSKTHNVFMRAKYELNRHLMVHTINDVQILRKKYLPILFLVPIQIPLKQAIKLIISEFPQHPKWAEIPIDNKQPPYETTTTSSTSQQFKNERRRSSCNQQ